MQPTTRYLRAGSVPLRRPFRPLWPPRPSTAVIASVIAAVGYGINYWAWTLVGPLGPELAHRYDLGAGALAVLGAAAVALGSLGRIPVGALADRFGPRAVLPAVSVAAAVPVAALAAVETLPELVMAACACGVAGTAF